MDIIYKCTYYLNNWNISSLKQECKDLDIPFHLMYGLAKDNIPKFTKDHSIGGVVTDFSPLRVPLSWMEDVKKELPEEIPFCQVPWQFSCNYQRHFHFAKEFYSRFLRFWSGFVLNWSLILSGRLMHTTLYLVGKHLQNWNTARERSEKRFTINFLLTLPNFLLLWNTLTNQRASPR